ncbi:MAG TPA: sulfotransferase domain-containing protein [Longimicrobiaceae bacterium]
MSADALICSHPRSGGRWLRYLIAHYLAAHHQLGLEVTPREVFTVVPDHHEDPVRGYPAYGFRGRVEVPLVAVCHQPYSWELHRGYPVVFLARNAYDVMVSAYHHLAHQKGEYIGSMREFIRHPRLGLPAWIEYFNRWAPKLLTHRDALLLSYRDLSADSAETLARVVRFLNHDPDPVLVAAAVESADRLRSGRDIKTGQEGNFWDHLQPDEIFDIQEEVGRGLSEFSVCLLHKMGVEVDPFPREEV